MKEHEKAHQISKVPESGLKRAGKRIGDALRKFKEPMDEEKLIIPQMDRRQFLKIGALTAAGAILSSTKLGKFVGMELGKAFAQDSFAELQQLEKISDEKIEKRIYNGYEVVQVVGESRLYNTAIQVPVPGENWVFYANVMIGWDEEKQRNDIIVTAVINGKRGGVKIPLDYLAQKYYDITGKKMEAVKLIGVVGRDREIGDYVSILVYPKDEASKDGTDKSVVKKGYPYMVITYAGGDIYADAKEHILLTPR